MKILITGGSGFIGSPIVGIYQDKAGEIRVLDNLRTGCRHNLDGLLHILLRARSPSVSWCARRSGGRR
jgi:UDP-glucose 4-epimerase